MNVSEWVDFLIDFDAVDRDEDEVRDVAGQTAALSLTEHMAISRLVLMRMKLRVEPTAVLGLFSGGRDSTTFMHLLKRHFDHAVHINTGIGIDETRHFVRRTCAMWRLPLIEETPPPGCTYDELVLQYGFPGPGGHMMMYSRLKERGLRAVRRRFVSNGRKERVMFVAGMRRFESGRRMRNTQITMREGSVVWVSPVSWWTNDHLQEYRDTHEVPINEVSTHLHMSGECLCGAFAKPDELEMIDFFYPKTAERIRDLEIKVRAAGLPACVWGQRPPKKGDPQPEETGLLCQKCEVV